MNGLLHHSSCQRSVWVFRFRSWKTWLNWVSTCMIWINWREHIWDALGAGLVSWPQPRQSPEPRTLQIMQRRAKKVNPSTWNKDAWFNQLVKLSVKLYKTVGFCDWLFVENNILIFYLYILCMLQLGYLEPQNRNWVLLDLPEPEICLSRFYKRSYCACFLVSSYFLSSILHQQEQWFHATLKQFASL